MYPGMNRHTAAIWLFIPDPLIVARKSGKIAIYEKLWWMNGFPILPHETKT